MHRVQSALQSKSVIVFIKSNKAMIEVSKFQKNCTSRYIPPVDPDVSVPVRSALLVPETQRVQHLVDDRPLLPAPRRKRHLAVIFLLRFCSSKFMQNINFFLLKFLFKSVFYESNVEYFFFSQDWPHLIVLVKVKIQRFCHSN